MENLEKENELLKLKIESASHQIAVLTWAVFFSTFTGIAIFVWLFYEKFYFEGIFEIQVICTGFATGIALLVSMALKKVLFGDVLKDYPDERLPKIDGKKDNLMIFLLVAMCYAIQFIGYRLFAR